MPRISFQGPDGTPRATYLAEYAADEASWERGLMGRTTMPADRAMLFVFPADAPRSFWMKDTLVALDIIFIRADGTVESIAPNVQPCVAEPCPVIRSKGPIRYVVEVVGNEAGRRGIGIGDVLVQED